MKKISSVSASLEAREGSTVTLLETFSECFHKGEYPLATMPILQTIPSLQSFTTGLCGVNQGKLFILKTDMPVYVTYIANPPEVATTMLLDVAVNETDVSFSFLDTSSFPYSGAAALGNEIFTWASKTTLTLDGIVRGAFGTTPVSHVATAMVTNLPITRLYTTHGFLITGSVSHVIVDNPNSGISPTGDATVEMAAVGV
jgi:hypothetical protein